MIRDAQIKLKLLKYEGLGQRCVTKLIRVGYFVSLLVKLRFGSWVLFRN
jgi:hypothetical protein